ncbi:MAG: flagellar hook basal-body protein [Vitreimonas sp.]
MGLLELGEVMMTRSERHLELTSQNLTNVSTPGYKQQVGFDAAIDGAQVDDRAQVQVSARPDFAQGALRQTGRPLDLGISGSGFFLLRTSDGHSFYTRNGQFSRDSQNRLVSAEGYALQAAGGGDLLLESDSAEILNDGTVLENGAPAGRVGIYAPNDAGHLAAQSGTLFTAPDDAMHEVASPLLRQGFLETANVNNATEMLQLMTSMRQAEAGARVVEAYDTLIGQSISTFGRSS